METSTSLDLVVSLAAQLSPGDRLKLVERIAHDLANSHSVAEPPPRKRFWREICGIVEYPMCGEDAQAWISRNRREDTEHRDKLLER